jgi:hypothetical protein
MQATRIQGSMDESAAGMKGSMNARLQEYKAA